MSAFSKREVALDLFNSARGIGTKRVFGAPNEDFQREVMVGRLNFINRALVAIDDAIGSERLLVQEPDDIKLAEFKAILKEQRQRIASVVLPLPAADRAYQKPGRQ